MEKREAVAAFLAKLQGQFDGWEMSADYRRELVDILFRRSAPVIEYATGRLTGAFSRKPPLSEVIMVLNRAQEAVERDRRPAGATTLPDPQTLAGGLSRLDTGALYERWRREVRRCEQQRAGSGAATFLPGYGEIPLEWLEMRRDLMQKILDERGG